MRMAKVVLPLALRPSMAMTAARSVGQCERPTQRSTTSVSGTTRHGPAGGSSGCNSMPVACLCAGVEAGAQLVLPVLPRREHLGVAAAGCHQFVVRARLHDA